MKRRQSWTSHDEMLLHTLHVATVLDRGGKHDDVAPAVGTPFPPQVSGEHMVAVRGYRRYDWEPMRTPPMEYTTSPMPFGGQMRHPTKRWRRQADAVAAGAHQWADRDVGELYVSSHGFYLYHGPLHSWHWHSVRAAELPLRGVWQMTGISEKGEVTWRFETELAELLFVLWALNRHPQHPQLVQHGWLPEGWLDHARGHDKLPAQMPPRAMLERGESPELDVRQFLNTNQGDDQR